MPTLLERQPDARRQLRGRTIAQESAPIEPDRWERRFADLLAFRSVHGHCNVPSNYEPDRSLAVWVFNCRRQRKLRNAQRRADRAAGRDRLRLGSAGSSLCRARLGCDGGPVGSILPEPRTLQRPSRFAALSRAVRVAEWSSLRQAVGPARRGPRAAVG